LHPSDSKSVPRFFPNLHSSILRQFSTTYIAQASRQETFNAQGQLQETSIAQSQLKETSDAQVLQAIYLYLFATINKFALTLDITMAV